MRKVIVSICLFTVAAVTVLVMAPGCKAEEALPEAQSGLQFEADGVPAKLGVSAELPRWAENKIVITGLKKEDGTNVILVVPSWAAVCKQNPTDCDGEEISWRVIGGGLQPGQTLVIRDADQSNHCFPNVPVTISPPANTAQSGPPLAACVSPSGHVWQYIVELYEAGQESPIASTDPGAIIFP